MVVELITEVADAFCNDEDDIGNVTDCKMKINLKDNAETIAPRSQELCGGLIK